MSPSPRPFQIALYKTGNEESGSFVPEAAAEITPVFRTSGLLRSLPGEDTKTLILLLTFVTVNGECHPSLLELATALRLPPFLMHRRLLGLTKRTFRGHPLVYPLKRESGLVNYSLSPQLYAFRTVEPAKDPGQERMQVALAGREAVIAQSRRLYGRPRTLVEAEIASLNGWPAPGEAPDQTAATHSNLSDPLWQRLLKLGIRSQEIERLRTTYPGELLERQVRWLPYRQARNPAAYLEAALANDYGPPRALRAEQGSNSPQDPAASSGRPDPAS